MISIHVFEEFAGVVGAGRVAAGEDGGVHAAGGKPFSIFVERKFYFLSGGRHKMTPKQWMFDPNSGGIKIPSAVQADIEKRIRAVAEKEFNGKYTRLEIRFKNQFCYIDAYTEPVLTDGWPPADWDETREEYAERLRNTPNHLCRLRYFGNDEWGFAFFTYSNEKYELSMYDDGQFTGKPERAFLISANVYLNE